MILKKYKIIKGRILKRRLYCGLICKECVFSDKELTECIISEDLNEEDKYAIDAEICESELDNRDYKHANYMYNIIKSPSLCS